MKKKILFLIITIIFYSSGVKALTYGGCDYSTISRLKSIVSNINISYDYHIENNKAYFDVTLTNITPDLFFEDSLNNEVYMYEDTNSGEITIRNYSTLSGNYQFYSANKNCYGFVLTTKYYKFPTYNPYYTRDICNDISNFNLCQKWTSVSYTEEEFQKKVLEYKNSLSNKDKNDDQSIEYEPDFLDKVVEFYINNYLYFLGGVIIVFGLIIIISRKNSKFKL